MKVKLNQILKEEKEVIGKPDGKNLELIGVSNTKGLLKSQATRIVNLSRYKVIKKNWFAYNPMRVNVGSIGYSYRNEHIGIVSPDYVVFSCAKVILPEYLLFLLKSEEGIEAINKNASGAVRKRLYFKDLAKIEIFLPSIKLQNERLKIFKDIKNLHEELSNKSLLTQLKQAILQEAIQGKLTRDWRGQNPELITGENSATTLLKNIKAEKAKLVKEKKIKKEKPLPAIEKVEIPFELPEGWVWCRVGDIFKSTSGGTPQRGNQDYWNGDIQWYKSGELNDSLLTKKSKELITIKGLKESSATLFPKGTLLIAMYGATAGKLAILNNDASTNQAVCGFFENSELPTKYLFNYFLANRFKMINESWGMSQPNISQTYLRNFVYALPSLEEQKAIVEKVEALMGKCTALEQEIIQSEQHVQMLMQAVLKEAFEGEEISKEPSPMVI